MLGGLLLRGTVYNPPRGRKKISYDAEVLSDFPAILPNLKETTFLRRPAKPVGSKMVKTTPARN
jgi:hypothetical protein